ncbi:hypothetical protein Tsubulata_009648 [Turnera subulata]|uniref:RHOMBOID-like protein n=1 Tax=Turnera subulata TaxID=218843 RepID=A0A9Q0GIK1_9ROSI|nr:hypothetical protein Tsubulata_009648 [Turnera subulata]
MEEEAPPKAEETRIDIINPPPPPPEEETNNRLSSQHFPGMNRIEDPEEEEEEEEEAAGGNHYNYKTPFFGWRRRGRRADTWLISIFLILHLLAFLATISLNDCRRNSHGQCALPALARMSFQPLRENPFLGPSASTLDKVGALRKALLLEHQTWRLFSSPWLHAGVIHLLINLVAIVFIGSYLEKEFGPLRIGLIYSLSAFSGTLLAALFVRDSPVVSSSAALSGLIGATLSALIRNWRIYTHKVAALLTILFVATCNLILGLLPYVDNYANIGGLLSGFLLGFGLLFTPQPRQVAQKKSALYGYDAKTSFNLKQTLQTSVKWKQMLDRPVLRSVSLVLFAVLFAALLLPVLLGINMSKYCSWCRYVDCLPSKMWSCNDMTTSCEAVKSESRNETEKLYYYFGDIFQAMASNSELTLTCMDNGNFGVLPYTNISQARTKDLCTMICS